MEPHALIVRLTFAVIGLVMTFVIITAARNGVPLAGKPTITPIYFYTSKLFFFVNWMMFLAKALFPKIGYIAVPGSLSWIGTILLLIGTILFILSVLELGRSLRFGIPEEETTLQTTGMFAISRNPLYLGMFIICIGSCLYFPDLLNLTFCVYTIGFHLKIIRNEEAFLANRFGEKWQSYTKRVRRLI
jgi:protein-S-isoprenylcysteine O-methyltransferase Ste14